MSVRVDTPDAVGLSVDTQVEPETVKARGYWELVWIRFRRDKIALLSFGVLVLLFAAAFGGAPLAAHLLGHGPNTIFDYGTNPTTFVPVGPHELKGIAGSHDLYRLAS